LTQLNMTPCQQICILAEELAIRNNQSSRLVDWTQPDVVSKVSGEFPKVSDGTHAFDDVVLLLTLGPAESEEGKDDCWWCTIT
jgi:hypothetical protein